LPGRTDIGGWLRLWLRYVRLGWRLRSLAVGQRSRLLLLYLGATTLLRSHPRLLSKPVRLNIRLGGVVYEVALRTRTELNTLYEIGVEDEYRPADAVPAEVLVDLGASIGLATLRLLASHPGAQVIAVEADPELIPRLSTNVADLPVTVVHAAVSGSTGSRVFYRSDMNSWGNSLEMTNPDKTAVMVPSLSFDDLLDEVGIDRVQLLKLDVEGAEWEIFDGDVSARVDAIIGEIHGRPGRDPDVFIDRLARSMRVETISAEPGRATFLATRR
jgi:FkbM family methyltransferase